MRVYGGLPKSWLEARWPDDAGPPVLPLPFFLPRRVEASPPARRGEEKKRSAGMLVNWLTPRAGEKSSQPQQRLRAERGWRHQWDYTTPTRPGLHRPWSSGFSPASVVGTCSRISWSSSRVERRLVQMVSIRAPVSDADAMAIAGRSSWEWGNNAQPQMEFQRFNGNKLNARCSRPSTSGRARAGVPPEPGRAAARSRNATVSRFVNSSDHAAGTVTRVVIALYPHSDFLAPIRPHRYKPPISDLRNPA